MVRPVPPCAMLLVRVLPVVESSAATRVIARGERRRDDRVQRAVHRVGGVLGVLAGRIDQHLRLVQHVGQIGPAVVVERTPHPRVLAVDERGGRVPHGQLDGSGRRDPLEMRGLADDAIADAHGFAQLAGPLLRQRDDVVFVLVNKCDGDLDAHGGHPCGTASR